MGRMNGEPINTGQRCSSSRARGIAQIAASVAMVAALGACANLPSSGPTARTVVRPPPDDANALQVRVVDLRPDTLPVNHAPGAADQDVLSAIGAGTILERSDFIRKGDQLSVSVYEVGVSLFGGVTALGSPIPTPETPTASAQRVTIQVDDDGRITLPYIGIVHVAGRTTADVNAMIQGRLREFSQSPQVIVAIADSPDNSVYLSGAVARPGRFKISSSRERLLDIVTLGGGPAVDPDDAELRLIRGMRVATIPLGALRAEDIGNIFVSPGDRIEVVRRRRTFTVLGASERVSQLPFDQARLTLAEAVARAGGPSDARADPRGVFLFRFEGQNADGVADPVIYRLDMMDPQSYFLAQMVDMRDKDVLYFAGAAANPASRFIGLLNQLFSPILTARVLTQ